MRTPVIFGIVVGLALAPFFIVGAQSYEYDLGIGTRDIFFSKPADQLIAGERVRIYGRIQNLGAKDVSGYLSFYQSNQLIGDSQVVTVRAKGADEEAWVDFTVPELPFNIRAEIRGTTPQDQNPGNDTAVSPMFEPKRDRDLDGVLDPADNCPEISNPDQRDADGDRLGDACDSDDDNDGITDGSEQVLGTSPTNPDSDADGVGDNQDLYPMDAARWAAPPAKPQPQSPPPSSPTSTAPDSSVPDSPAPASALPATATSSDQLSSSIAEEVSGETQSPPTLVPASALARRRAWNTYEFEANGIGEGMGVTALWDFGDGETSSAARVMHRFRRPGSYVVRLAVTNTQGVTARDASRVDISFFNPGNWRLWLLLGILASFSAVMWFCRRRLIPNAANSLQ